MEDMRGRRSKSPFRINFKEKHLYNLFRYTLLAFNAFLMILIMGGVFVYFTELRNKTFPLNTIEEDNFLAGGRLVNDSTVAKGHSKWSWLTPSMAFGLLLTIPCTGFVGALKEQHCLLIVYGVLFFVEAVICLIYKTFWFLFPAFLAVCAIGLVFLKRTERGQRTRFLPFRPAKAGRELEEEDHLRAI